MTPTDTVPQFSLDEVVSSPQAKRQFLRGLPFLHGVDEDLCNAIADSSVHLHRDGGDVIVRQGDPPGNAVVVLRGLMELSHADRSTTPAVTLYYLPYRRAGEPGGLNNLVCQDTHGYTVRAVMPTDLLQLDAKVFLECFRRSPALARNIIFYLKTYFGGSCERMGHTAALKTKQARIVGELLEIAQALQVRVVTHPDDDPGRIVIDWLQRPQLIEKTGVSPAHTARALQLLTADRFKDARRKKIACSPFIARNPVTGVITIEPIQMKRLQILYHHLATFSLEAAIAHMITHRPDVEIDDAVST